jgi:hypothetical protein
MWHSTLWVEINTWLKLWRKISKTLGLFFYFQTTAQSSQSPNEQKFAQSGHPASNRPLSLPENFSSLSILNRLKNGFELCSSKVVKIQTIKFDQKCQPLLTQEGFKQ